MKKPVRLSTQMLLVQIGVLVLVGMVGIGLMALVLRQALIAQYEHRAMAIGRSVAADERYARAVTAGGGSDQVQVLAEAVRRRTSAGR